MTEAQLVAGAIQDVKDRGYGSSYLYDEDTQKHCILGSIGYARWGEQWDLDCSDPYTSFDNTMYKRLAADPVTRALIGRITDAIKSKTDRTMPSRRFDQFVDECLMVYVYGWNDDLKDAVGKENVLEILEKVQADIGIELERIQRA